MIWYSPSLPPPTRQQTLLLPAPDSQRPHLARPQIDRANQVVPAITDIGHIGRHVRRQAPGLAELRRGGAPVLVPPLARPGQAGGGGLAACVVCGL